jgi:hypothetical protein
MRFTTPGIPLACVFALLSSGPAFTQSTSTSSGSVANIYIQSHVGVYVYNANAAGQLTLVKGSAFADTGQMGGVRGSYLISVGTNALHTYHIGANGAVGSQAGVIYTSSYGGSQCGPNEGPALLDHTGQYFAVDLTDQSGNATNPCSALQTYKIGSTGQFTFLGDSVSTGSYHNLAFPTNVETYSSNDVFAYGVQSQVYANAWVPFKRASAGDLVADSSFTSSGPTPNPSMTNNTGNYFPDLVAADGASHLAAVVDTPFAQTDTFQLASFTIKDTTGAVTSTNTYANMPVLNSPPESIGMNWAGNVVAVGGAPGLQLFHFNGAAPATTFGPTLLPSVYIDKVGWDKNNHLYAVSYESQQLHVFTVTSTGATEAPGSPYTLNKAYGNNGLIVVPTT